MLQQQRVMCGWHERQKGPPCRPSLLIVNLMSDTEHSRGCGVVGCICLETGERMTATIVGGGGFTLEAEETEPDFMARVTAVAAQSVLLPDNGR